MAKNKKVTGKKVLIGIIMVVGFIAAVITIWPIVFPPGEERSINLIFVDQTNSPYKHSRVNVAGLSLDLSTTSDGDVSFTISKATKVITGVIYCPAPKKFKVTLIDGVDNYLVTIS